MSDIDFDKIKEGDEVWLRGKWIGDYPTNRYSRVNVACYDLVIGRTAVVKHIPQAWVPEVGDVVKYLSEEGGYVILATDEDKAWLKGGGYRFVASFDRLTLIRKGGER